MKERKLLNDWFVVSGNCYFFFKQFFIFQYCCCLRSFSKFQIDSFSSFRMNIIVCFESFFSYFSLENWIFFFQKNNYQIFFSILVLINMFITLLTKKNIVITWSNNFFHNNHHQILLNFIVFHFTHLIYLGYFQTFSVDDYIDIYDLHFSLLSFLMIASSISSSSYLITLMKIFI